MHGQSWEVWRSRPDSEGLGWGGQLILLQLPHPQPRRLGWLVLMPTLAYTHKPSSAFIPAKEQGPGLVWTAIPKAALGFGWGILAGSAEQGSS